jgi:hypothetical protein
MRGSGRRQLLLLAGVALLLTACAAGSNPMEGQGHDQAGFWLGLWQGLIIPITFIVSLFNDHVSIYEVDNNGNWYDFGFVLGVAIVFSGPAGAGFRGSRR